MPKHVSAEALKAGAARELVRVEEMGEFVVLWIGAVVVRRWENTDAAKRSASVVAEAIRGELGREFEQRARAVAYACKYREVKHY